MRGACACLASSRRRMTRPSSHWSWCSGRSDGTSQLSTTIQCGAWTSRASETTARRLPSDKRTRLLEPIKQLELSTDLMATVGKIKAEYDATPLRYEAERNPHRRHRPRRWRLRPLQGAGPAGERHQCRRGGSHRARTACVFETSCGSRAASGSRTRHARCRRTMP